MTPGIEDIPRFRKREKKGRVATLRDLRRKAAALSHQA